MDFAFRFFYLNLKSFIETIKFYGKLYGENTIENLLNKMESFRQHLVNHSRKIVEGFQIDDITNIGILTNCVCLLIQFESLENISKKNLKESFEMLGKIDLADLLKCDKNEDEIISE